MLREKNSKRRNSPDPDIRDLELRINGLELIQKRVFQSSARNILYV